MPPKSDRSISLTMYDELSTPFQVRIYAILPPNISAYFYTPGQSILIIQMALFNPLDTRAWWDTGRLFLKRTVGAEFSWSGLFLDTVHM